MTVDPLATLLATYKQRLSEIDNVPATQRAFATYTTDDGRSFDWGGYRQHLLDSIEKILKIIQPSSIQLNGPIEVWA